MDDNLAATYILIHAFLIKHTHSKAAQALKKAVKDLVILKDDVIPEEPSLDEIIKKWKAAEQQREKSSSEAKSSSSSSSSSESDSEPEPPAAKPNPTTTKRKRVDSSSSSSSSYSDPSDSDSPSQPSPKDLQAKNNPIATERDSSRTLSGSGVASGPATGDEKSESDACQLESTDASSSSSSSDDEDSEPEVKQKGQTKLEDAAAMSSDDSDSNDCSEQSDSDDMEVEQVTIANQKSLSSSNASKHQTSKLLNTSSSSSTPESSGSESESDAKGKQSSSVAKRASSSSPRPKSSAKNDSSSSSSPESGFKTKTVLLAAKGKNTKASDAPNRLESKASAKQITVHEKEEKRVTKKRRMHADGSSVPTAVANPLKEDTKFSGNDRKEGKNPRTTNNRFMRVDPTKLQSVVDNSYVSKVAPSNDYGRRAHQDLIVTRGAGFRKEKNKKKRGSYRGGEITMESHSFKFN